MAGVLALGPVTAHAAAGDYDIDGVANTGANTLQQDIKALTDAPDQHIIKLNKSISNTDGLAIGSKLITFELNGFDLTLSSTAPGSNALSVSGTTVVNYTGAGNFTANGAAGTNVALYVYSGAAVTLTGVSAVDSRAIMNYGQVTVNGNVTTGTGDAIYVSSDARPSVVINGNVVTSGGGTAAVVATGGKTEVTINGNVTATDASGGSGIDAYGGAKVHVTGNVTAPNGALYAEGPCEITVDGDVITITPGGSAVDAIATRNAAAIVNVGGNVTFTVTGTCGNNDAIGNNVGTVTISGNVTSNCGGVMVWLNNARVTIDGKLTAPDTRYIHDGFDNKTQADKTQPTSKIGYDTYFGVPNVDDGTPVAWVKTLSSDAKLDTVDYIVVAQGPQAGTLADPKQATVTWAATCQASIDLSDLAVDAGATPYMYSDDKFTLSINTIAINPNGTTHVYVKVVAQDSVTTLYYDVTLQPTGCVIASSDAGLGTVGGQAVVPGAQAGTLANPKLAGVTLTVCKATDITLADIVTTDPTATALLYSDAAFTTNVASISLNQGGYTDVYVKVTAADGKTVLYYHVQVYAGCGPEMLATLPNGQVGVAYNSKVLVNGAPSGTMCTAAAGSTIASTNLSYAVAGATVSGTPTQVGTYTISITCTDVTGSTTKDYTVTIDPAAAAPVMIGAGALPNGVVNTPYTATAVTTTAGATCTLNAGALLPPGMWLDATTNEVKGTPTAVGTYNNIGITCSKGGVTATQTYTVTINPAAAAPVFALGGLPNGQVGVAYSATIGVTPAGATCSLDAGALPDGLTLDAATCTISGNPSKAGPFNFTIKASNTAGDATQAYTVTIAPAGAPVITGTLPDGIVGVYYSAGLTVTPAGSTCSVSAGSVPDGLLFDAAACKLSGWPSKDGTFTFTIKASNAAGDTTQAYTVTISPAGAPGTNSGVNSVPTLGEWALLLLAALLGGAGFAVQRRHNG